MNPTGCARRQKVFAPSLCVGLCLLVLPKLAGADEAVDFLRDVQPILAAHCYDCHGADEQESGFRVDTGVTLLAGGNSGPALIAGKSGQSRIIKALRGNDGEVPKMPPEGPALSPEQIEVVVRWIDQGAKVPAQTPAVAHHRTSDHWSFQPLAEVEPPAVQHIGWPRNPLDAFILARLEAAGLAPSVEADKSTLIRRVSLDLTGLPPSVAEVDAFLADQRDDAYESLVDRLLSSPRYGEHWGRHWLDLARYADSNGYTIDSGRSIWKYRDWVIAALNRDLPFDRFTIEQLAGDMLPGARTDQIVATGFHRNTMVNEEGGTDDEQFRVEAVVDRVSTTGEVFLGLTLGCARCHEHKFDPISQREFYELFAIFNNCDEPTLPVPTEQQAKEMPALLAEIKQVNERLATVDANSAGRQAEWERTFSGHTTVNWTALDASAKSAGGATITKQTDNSFLVGGNIPSGDTYTIAAPHPKFPVRAVLLEALPDASLPGKGPGLSKTGGFVLGKVTFAVTTPDGESRNIPVLEARSEYSPDNGPIAHAIDGDPATGWRVVVAKDLGVPRTAIFVLDQSVSPSDQDRLSVTLAHEDRSKPLQLGRFRVSVTDASHLVLTLPTDLRDALATPRDERTDAQKKVLREAYQKIDPERVPLVAQLAELNQRKQQIKKAITTTLVMHERQQPRETHIHLRGDFLSPGAAVEPDVPDVLPPIRARGTWADRLDFARWLVDPANPRTARVTVNRVWQRHFGRGLVATENDFGTQGDPPTHPELLDWLARQFIADGWSMKALHRRIVTSATYRQSSHQRDDLTAADPYNKLLGRQARLRVQAEAIRDVALAASGLLSDEIGGPGVYPPQPEGIYRFTQQKKYWGESQGADRYRRGMYTYLWRSSPYPFLKTFDAPDATVACTRRTRSNTPLQALTLANDPAFFEIAQGFATRVLAEPADSDEARIRYAFRRCMARQPSSEELAALVGYLRAQQQHFADSSDDAASVAAKVHVKNVDSAGAAAWTMLARVLLNLDEFITRE